MKANLMTSFMVPMKKLLLGFVISLYLDSSMVLYKSLMTPLMVPMMAFLLVHKRKHYLAANVMAPLMDTMMAFLWVNRWKLYLASSMVRMKSNMIDYLMVLCNRHT